MSSHSIVLYLLIVGCEVAFWLVLLFSLVVRYLLHRKVPSRWLLLSLPIIDVLLVVFTALDLRDGTTATVAHGLATAYVGFTIAFGSIAVRWADAQFAYRFANGPAPPKSPIGWKAVRLEIELWMRCIGAWIIAFTLIEALVAFVGSVSVTQPLYAWHRIGFGCVFFWFIFGPAWSVAFFRRDAP